MTEDLDSRIKSDWEGLIHSPEHIEVPDSGDNDEFIGFFDTDGGPFNRL
jgi:hypothetical protein